MFIPFQVPLINKNGTKSMHCIIRGKFVISPCRKSALFWIHAVILLFHAEILPCGPPLLPHSCAEPFLGVMQKYSFLGDTIYTSCHSDKLIKWCSPLNRVESIEDSIAIIIKFPNYFQLSDGGHIIVSNSS